MSAVARSWVLLAVALVVIVGAAVWASAGSGPRTMDDRVRDVASGLRCPVCMNLSVADSPSHLAGEMRAEIEARLRAGAAPDQIRAYFVDRYGDWVLLEPPKRGLNLILWFVPMAGVVGGFLGWAAFVRRRSPEERAPG